MLDHALEAASLVENRTRQDLCNDRMLNLSVVRLLEIIGEAANRISEEERRKYPGVPWKDIIGLRNRLIHAYDSVDLEIVWQIAKEDVPELVATLHTILGRK
jgi:uncharacterized protein with HEPN domain